MTPAAAAMQAEVLTLQGQIFEEAQGLATHAGLPELKSRLAAQAETIR